MIETQVLMAVSDLLRFFSRNHFLEGGFTGAGTFFGGGAWGGIGFNKGWGWGSK